MGPACSHNLIQVGSKGSVAGKLGLVGISTVTLVGDGTDLGLELGLGAELGLGLKLEPELELESELELTVAVVAEFPFLGTSGSVFPSVAVVFISLLKPSMYL
jgi:hypothetical protein